MSAGGGAGDGASRSSTGGASASPSLGMSRISGGVNTSSDDNFYENGEPPMHHTAHDTTTDAVYGLDDSSNDVNDDVFTMTSAGATSALLGGGDPPLQDEEEEEEDLNNLFNLDDGSTTGAMNFTAATHDTNLTAAANTESNLAGEEGAAREDPSDVLTSSSPPPGDDSFESALRDIGADDAIVRSVLSNTTSASAGGTDEDHSSVIRSVLSDGAASVLSNGAASVLSDGAASVLSNGAASVLSNGAASVLSNGAASAVSVVSGVASAVVRAVSPTSGLFDDNEEEVEEEEEEQQQQQNDAVLNGVQNGRASSDIPHATAAATAPSRASSDFPQATATTTAPPRATSDFPQATAAPAATNGAAARATNGSAPGHHAHELPHYGSAQFTRFPMKGAAGPSAPRSEVSAAPTTMTTMSRFNRRVGGAFENLADKIFIPSYPDDERPHDEHRSAVAGAGGGGRRGGRAATTISAATTSRLVPNGDAVNPSTAAGGAAAAAARDSFRSPKIADALGRPGAGGGGRRRRGGRRNRGLGAIGRPDMIRRAIEQEERSEMMSAATGMSAAAHGHGGGGLAARAYRSELGGRSAISAAQGGKAGTRISGPASEMMISGMDDTRSGISGLRPWMRNARSRFGGPKSAISGAMSETPTVWKNFHEDDITPGDAADADDPGQARMYIDEEEVDVTVCCGQWALWKPKTIAYGGDKVVELAEPDAENKRIVKLGIPYTLSAVSEAIFEAVIVGIIAHYLGTNAVTAYVVVELLLGLTDELVAGIIDAEGTICTHAYGAGNNFLAGQYVQIAAVLYVICSIPFLIMWALVMGDTLAVLGFNEDVQTMGIEYTRVVIFHYLIEGVSECFSNLLDITDHEYFGLALDLVHGVLTLVAVLCLVILVPDTRLVTVGFIDLVFSATFLVIMLSWAITKGWFSAFWRGMLGSVAIFNQHAVKNVISTAVPLSVGSFLEYGEWELLTFFTAYLGPAEVASWALLGTIWELFEASTEGMGDAAAVRVAYHLGKGNPEMARKSSYKSLLLCFVASIFITSFFFLCGYDLPTWFSTDETIQRMIADLIPLVGLGNITMSFGMVCWSLVGAQGRFRLATLVSMISSWFVTIPLSAIFTVALNFNLKGLVGAVIVGYSTSTAMLMYILIRSDWQRLSKIVQELNSMTGEVDSSDSEDEEESASSASGDDSDDDSSSSSSSSSSSDDDSDLDDSDLNISHVSQKHLLA